MPVVFAGVVAPVGIPGAALGGEEGAVDQDHLPALPGDLLQGAVQARRLRGEQGNQLVATAADGRLGHVVAAGHVGQALVVAQHSQDDHRDLPGRQGPPPGPDYFQVTPQQIDQLPTQRLQLGPLAGIDSQGVADLPGHARSGGLPRGGKDALVVRREHGLLHVRRSVRDQHHRSSAHLPGRRRGRGAFVGKLFAHPLKNPLRDGELVPLGPHLRQLLGEQFLTFVQFRTGDPFQQLIREDVHPVHVSRRGCRPDRCRERRRTSCRG